MVTKPENTVVYGAAIKTFIVKINDQFPYHIDTSPLICKWLCERGKS